jgi:hypothetical protein
VVQQESTATGLDPEGLVCTLRDGDLRLHTLVDGLPLDGMQEVWGSNPHSSTGQKNNSKTRAASTAGKYRNGNCPRWRTPVRIGHLPRLVLLGRAREFRAMDLVVNPLSWANALFFDPSTLAAQPPAQSAGQAVPTLTLGASAGGQQGLSSGRRPGRGVWVWRDGAGARRGCAPLA